MHFSCLPPLSPLSPLSPSPDNSPTSSSPSSLFDALPPIRFCWLRFEIFCGTGKEGGWKKKKKKKTTTMIYAIKWCKETHETRGHTRPDLLSLPDRPEVRAPRPVLGPGTVLICHPVGPIRRPFLVGELKHPGKPALETRLCPFRRLPLFLAFWRDLQCPRGNIGWVEVKPTRCRLDNRTEGAFWGDRREFFLFLALVCTGFSFLLFYFFPFFLSTPPFIYLHLYNQYHILPSPPITRIEINTSLFCDSFNWYALQKLKPY